MSRITPVMPGFQPMNLLPESERRYLFMLSPRMKLLALSSIVGLALLARSVCFVGLIGSDDLTYNQRAYEIVTGTFASFLSLT